MQTSRSLLSCVNLLAPSGSNLLRVACCVSFFCIACGGESASFDALSGNFEQGATAYLPPVATSAEIQAGQAAYVRTEEDPFSTFAADVDSASYDLFVSQLTSNGQLLPVDSVRTEEFINSFKYDYPAPTSRSEHPFAISVSGSVGLYQASTALLRVGIQSQSPEAYEKKPANLVFLVDTSGSMQEPNKLPLVQRVLLETLELLDPGDSVAIVTYAGSTRVALPSTPVSSASQIRSVISGLQSGGSTAGASGLDLAYEEVGKHFVEGGINHVVLCTDGDFNVGPSSTEELVALIEQKRETGITFTAVGFGDYPNDQMLEAISNKGNGVYGVVATDEQAEDYANERLLSSLQLVAKDVKIQVEFNPEKVYAYRLIGYENRQLADYEFYQDPIDAGEVGAGHRVTALYELALAQDDLPQSAVLGGGGDADAVREIEDAELALVKVRYKKLDMGAQDESLEVRQGFEEGQMDAGDSDLKWIAGVAAFAEVLGEGRDATSATLDMIDGLLEQGMNSDGQREEFRELVTQARTLLPR